MAETNQSTGEPSERIDTSPTIFRPCILCTHDQHAADYIRIMVKSGMSLPMGEDWSASLVMEVMSLLLPYAIPIPSLISLLVLLGITIYSLFTAFVFTQALQKNRLVNHICTLAELLHANAMQQLELALLGSPAEKIVGCASDGPSAPNNIFTFGFCASSSISNFVYGLLTPFSSNHWYNTYGGAC